MVNKPPIKIVYFSRKPRPLGNFSIETYFKLIRESLPPQFECVNVEMPFENNGLFKRLANSIYCIFKQGDINHITGDIHYVGLFLRKRKTILTILDCGMLHEATGLKFKIFKWFWFTLPIARANTIVAISTATKNDIIKFTNCPADKIKVIYIAISNSFKKAEKIFNEQKPRILQIGTAPNKNLERLIPALNNIQCKLVIIGKVGEHIRSLLLENNIDHELISVKLPENEIVEEYEKCDILAFVSTLEGFGMPIIEANTVGRAVITSNTTSMPEIALDAACIVDPFDIKAIHEGIKKKAGDKLYRETLIENGSKNAQRFSVKELAMEHASLYKQITSP